jgi:3-phosphoshikimate 1-carboxyvinyltransferase
VRGPLAAPEEPLIVEADASAAAVALAAAVASGGHARALGVGRCSLQGDRACVEVLRAFGAEAGADDESLWARGALTRGAELDLAATPDLAPVAAALAILAARRCGAASTLLGLGTLAGKESDRLAGLGDLAGLAGARAESSAGSLHIGPKAGPSARRIAVDPRGDHRMAFAAAILGCGGLEVDVRDPTCVGKSWPRFWVDLARIGAAIEPRTA